MMSARLETCDNDKVLTAVDKGVMVYPDSTGLWKIKGWICYGRNQFDPMLKTFSRALELASTFIFCIFDLAACLLKRLNHFS